MPKPLASSSRPSDLLYSPLPSASINTRSPTPWALPHAFITKTSFTAMQAMVSTPLARIWSASCTKPGRCLASQVGVKAPGTENSTTVLPLKSSSVVMSFGPSLVIRLSLPAGMRSPALMAIRISFLKFKHLVSARDLLGLTALLRRFGLIGLAYGRSTALFRVQAPQVRQPLERRVTLDRLEG